jgi:20S proteasome subunit beta 3
MEYNGAAIVAMVGKECVAIAADTRLGAQAQTVAFDFQKMFQMGPKLFVGLPGLATDVLTM